MKNCLVRILFHLIKLFQSIGAILGSVRFSSVRFGSTNIGFGLVLVRLQKLGSVSSWYPDSLDEASSNFNTFLSQVVADSLVGVKEAFDPLFFSFTSLDS